MLIKAPDGKIYDLSNGHPREIQGSPGVSCGRKGLEFPYPDENSAMVSTMEDSSHSVELREENNAMISTMEDTSHSLELRP